VTSIKISDDKPRGSETAKQKTLRGRYLMEHKCHEGFSAVTESILLRSYLFKSGDCCRWELSSVYEVCVFPALQ